ncbi:MAG: hypothetical protein LBQ30_06925 [Treponema sp.]|jgi:hypothetical protein|nr:hypothetical protein [Treponema sp.]
MDYKNVFNRFKDERAFIKTTGKPNLDRAQKASLNRKGNILYNAGDIEGAKKIFLTTGYSDGLSRIGDYYKSQDRYVEALRMYWLAPDKRKFESMAMQFSVLIHNLIYEEGDPPNE